MGKLEQSVARDIRNTKIQHAILAGVGLGGIIVVGVIAPNAIKFLAPFVKKNLIKLNQKQTAERAFWRLINAGYITLEPTKMGKKARLTTKGSQALTLFEMTQKPLTKPKRWDGKWRVLIFDIKESRRNIRDTLRDMLLKIGFVKLQKSVWVYPYDVEDLITLLKVHFQIGKEVLYLIVDRIENDTHLKRHFSLKGN